MHITADVNCLNLAISITIINLISKKLINYVYFLKITAFHLFSSFLMFIIKARGIEEMIINFTVQNYKSIKARMLLNLTAAKRLKLVDTIPVSRYGMNVLPVTGIYGANGSGKSNLAKAIKFMKSRILGEMTASIPFLYESEEQERLPSEFSMLFTDDSGLMYHYGFSIYGLEIMEEWLSAYYTKRESVLFTRTRENDDEEFEYYYGSRFIEATTGGRNYLEFTRKSLSSKKLFLSELAERNINTACNDVKSWFDNKLIIIDPDTSTYGITERILQDEEYSNKVTETLKQMDFDFDGFDVMHKEIDLETILNTELYDNEERVRIRQEIENAKEGVWSSRNRKHVIYQKSDDGHLSEKCLYIRHSRKDGSSTRLPISETSSGFKRLLDFSSLIIDNSSLANASIVIDEIERSLHTMISQNLISLFKANSLASLHSQLIFITHDTNLLNLDILRRDEIEFMEKDGNDNSSYITNYAEFKVIPGLNIEKGYLEGRFGAIPIMHHNLYE